MNNNKYDTQFRCHMVLTTTLTLKVKEQNIQKITPTDSQHRVFRIFLRVFRVFCYFTRYYLAIITITLVAGH